MFRALLWKEWRQLALVRWGGIALGALLPIAFTAGAELAKRGMLPTGDVKAYSPRDLMFELLPMALGLALWPLMALLVTVQAFASDRAAGTEGFLLERPVPRKTVWLARLAASLATLALVMTVTAALGATIGAITGPPPGTGWSRWMEAAAGGSGLALLAFLGGLLAASLVTSPMGAVLGGAVLAGLPVLLAAQLAAGFIHASYREVPLGGALSILMLPAYVVASWASACRGEPAGRGRIRRGVVIACGSLLAVLALFFLSATVVVRASASTGMHDVVPSPSGREAFIRSSGHRVTGGWVVETASGSKRGFVAPPGWDAAWSPDGSQFAVVTSSGPFGRAKGQVRIDIFQSDRAGVVRSIEIPESRIVYDMAWVRDGIVLVDLHDAPPGRKSSAADVQVDIIDPVSGTWRTTGFSEGGWSKSFVGPRPDGRLFVRVPVYDRGADGEQIPRGAQLHPIDVGAARVGEPLADTDGRPWIFAFNGLSRSDRLARVKQPGGDPGATRFVDLRSGQDLGPSTSVPGAQWVEGDRVVWLESVGHRSRLFAASPGAAPVALREWTDAQVGLQRSPDARAIFVSALPAGGPPAVDGNRRPPDPALFDLPVSAGAVPEEVVFLPEEARWITMPVFSGRPSDLRYTLWAGPKTLARVADGLVYFEDIDKPGERRFVLGSERDLR